MVHETRPPFPATRPLLFLWLCHCAWAVATVPERSEFDRRRRRPATHSRWAECVVREEQRAINVRRRDWDCFSRSARSRHFQPAPPSIPFGVQERHRETHHRVPAKTRSMALGHGSNVVASPRRQKKCFRCHRAHRAPRVPISLAHARHTQSWQMRPAAFSSQTSPRGHFPQRQHHAREFAPAKGWPQGSGVVQSRFQ